MINVVTEGYVTVRRERLPSQTAGSTLGLGLSLAVAMLVVVGGLAGTAGARADAAAGDTPMAVVRVTVDGALGVLRDKVTPIAQRRRQLRQIVEDHFDFTRMSRSALGYHWRSLTPEQRRNFTAVFTDFVENSYLNKIQDYQGETVAFLKEVRGDHDYGEVKTNIIQQGRQPIALDYLLIREQGGWKIYDVTVDNISIIANYRNQFNRVINNAGFNRLMADLERKRTELANSLVTQ